MANEFIARKGLIVSGSAIVTGSLNVSAGITGSLLGTGSWAENVVSASYAATASLLLGSVVSASYAATASVGLVAKAVDIIEGSIGTNLTQYTGSFTGSLTGGLIGTASWATNAVTASYVSGAASTWDSISNKPDGILSSSTQINALGDVSASYATQAGAVDYTNVSNKPTLVSASSQVSYTGLSNIPSGIVSSSGQVDVRNTTGIATIATTGSNTFTGIQTITNTTNATNYNNGALIVDGGVGIEKDIYIGGDIRLSGTLYAVSQSILLITSSIIDVQSNRIITNIISPDRFGGLSVNDSGSTGRSGSLLWDSYENRWVYQNETGLAYSSAIIIAGPKHSGSLGQERGLITGRIPVATGDDHIDTAQASSSMYVDFATLRTHIEAGLNVTGSVTASTGFSGDGSKITGVISSSFATTASAATSITFTPATASYAISSSRTITSSLALSADYTNITNKPTLISASSQVDHDATTNFVANKHIDHSTVSITAGSGLTGGGTIAATRTLDIGAGLGITVNADDVALNTSSAHFVTGSRGTISSTNTAGASGINLTYNTATGTISGSLVNSSVTVNGQAISLGGSGTVTANTTNTLTLGNGLTGTSFNGNAAVTTTVDTGSAHFITGSISALNLKGVVSSSSQVSYTGLSNIPSGILSSSTQINALSGVSASYAATASLLLGSVVSASFATTAATASSFSGSLQVVGMSDFTDGLTVSGGLYVSASDTTAANKFLVLNTSTSQVFTTASIGTVTSASYALTSSFALNAGSGLSGGTANYIPLWTSATAQSSSIIYQTGGNVGINTTAPNRQLSVNGNANITGSLDVTSAFTAQTKSFKILHQRLSGKSLVYGVLEGPEHAVYARGRLKGSTIITLPEEWEWLVDMESATVNLTPIGTHQKLYVDGVYGTRIVIGNDNILHREIDCYYTVIATRKDVHPLKTVE